MTRMSILLVAAVSLFFLASCAGGSGSSNGASGSTMEAQMTAMTNWEVHQTVDQ